MRPDGSGAHMLVIGLLPNWSPDGRRVAYARGPDVFAVRTGGGGRRRVAAARNRNTIPAGLSWSPDGRRIVFVHQDSRMDHDSSSIVTIPAGGGRERVHRVSERFIGSVDWQPLHW